MSGAGGAASVGPPATFNPALPAMADSFSRAVDTLHLPGVEGYERRLPTD